MNRDSAALRPPGDRDLDRFPRRTLTTRRTLFRGHRSVRGPWWFSSSMDGRFDLAAPRGTCYTALDERTAIRETVGAALTTLGVISHEFATARSVSRLRVPRPHRLADTCAESAADFGLTRELVTITPYGIPQAWAAAFDERFDGIRYETRFTTTAQANAAALFGAAGEATWLTDAAPAGFAALARECGFTIAPRPRTVRIVTPPT